MRSAEMSGAHDPQHVLVDALGRVAPDIDVASLDVDADLREEAQLDSMDLLNIVTAIHETTGLVIPERDYPNLSTWSSFIDYLSIKL